MAEAINATINEVMNHAGISFMERRMNLELIETIKLKQKIDRILHAAGNLQEKNLEMAVVIDWNLDREQVKNTTIHIMKTLKGHSEKFRNVRLNVVSWKADEEIINDVIPMPMMMIGKYFDHYEMINREKALDNLVVYLRKFQARSKVIIVISDGGFHTLDIVQMEKDMHPFLIKKTLLVCNDMVLESLTSR